jgi:hypothetical protein
MRETLRQQKLPDVSADQRISNDLVKRVRKLRWIGMDDEARRVEQKLCHLRPTDSVLAEPSGSD